jgi:hypothetical protein
MDLGRKIRTIVVVPKEIPVEAPSEPKEPVKVGR